MTYKSRNCSHSSPTAAAIYRRQYSAYKTLLSYPFEGTIDRLEFITTHPHFRCIHLPALYSTLLDHRPKTVRLTKLEIQKRKLAALDDVLSFLDSLSYGVIK